MSQSPMLTSAESTGAADTTVIKLQLQQNGDKINKAIYTIGNLLTPQSRCGRRDAQIITVPQISGKFGPSYPSVT